MKATLWNSLFTLSKKFPSQPCKLPCLLEIKKPLYSLSSFRRTSIFIMASPAQKCFGMLTFPDTNNLSNGYLERCLALCLAVNDSFWAMTIELPLGSPIPLESTNEEENHK